MIIGVLSDTHGHLPRTEEALRILKDAGAQHLIHCGDLGSDEVVSLLFAEQESGIPVTAVPGNVDEWDPGLIVYAKKLGLSLARMQRITLDGLQVAVHHGHDPVLMSRLSTDPDVDILFTGHTHVAMDDTSGPVRVINPGAVYRANPPGVSVFDTETKSLEFIPLSL